jgi:nitroreductase
MTFDVAEIDRLLTTTRAVRKRLDFAREVPDETLLQMIDVAEQAPSGSNQASRRWIVIRDPQVKRTIAELYREAGLGLLMDLADASEARNGGRTQRVVSSAVHLAENLERVPVLVILAIWGVHDGSGRPSLFDSAIQSGWSFCLAARARGIGTAWTTLHLMRATEVTKVLGIPPGVSQIALFPVAYTVSDEFEPVPRRPASEITFFDSWGFTDSNLSAGRRAHPWHGRGVTVEMDIDATPERLWELVSDITTPGRHCREAAGAAWDDDGAHGVGSTFKGRNATDDCGHPLIDAVVVRLVGSMEWETPCWVSVWEPGRRFMYNVGDPDTPWTQWGFTLEPLVGGGTRVRHFFIHGPGMTGTSLAATENPAEADAIIAGRFHCIRDNMSQVLAGIRREAES